MKLLCRALDLKSLENRGKLFTHVVCFARTILSLLELKLSMMARAEKHILMWANFLTAKWVVEVWITLGKGAYSTCLPSLFFHLVEIKPLFKLTWHTAYTGLNQSNCHTRWSLNMILPNKSTLLRKIASSLSQSFKNWLNFD